MAFTCTHLILRHGILSSQLFSDVSMIDMIDSVLIAMQRSPTLLFSSVKGSAKLAESGMV
jgi:hypothetical protein